MGPEVPITLALRGFWLANGVLRWALSITS